MGRFTSGGRAKVQEAHGKGFAAGYERATHGGDVTDIDVPWRYAKPHPDETGRVKGNGTPETESAYIRGFESGARKHSIDRKRRGR